ncbi:zinc ribbon domain-containing protein [Streptococcus suis]|nr:zinc ribbon domain-containing protein [Streptococcus suis]
MKHTLVLPEELNSKLLIAEEDPTIVAHWNSIGVNNSTEMLEKTCMFLNEYDKKLNIVGYYFENEDVIKERVKNQYYVEGNHEPIIEPWIWAAAQLEFERRETFKQTHGIKNYAQNIESNPFSSKVFCGVCGLAFARKHWTTTQGKRAVWQCGSRYKKKGELGCSNSHIDEETLQKAFLMAMTELSIHQHECELK